MKSSKHQTPSSRETWWNHPQPFEDGLILKEEPGNRHPFDLEERTAVFGERIVRFSKRIPRCPTNDRWIHQLVGSGTSIGANYCEANEGVSKKDFQHPISRCAKEAKETKFFLRMIVASEPELAEEPVSCTEKPTSFSSFSSACVENES